MIFFLFVTDFLIHIVNGDVRMQNISHLGNAMPWLKINVTQVNLLNSSITYAGNKDTVTGVSDEYSYTQTNTVSTGTCWHTNIESLAGFTKLGNAPSC